MNGAISRRLAPDSVLHPPTTFDAPDSLVTERVADQIEFFFGHVHILQPALEVAQGFYVIVFADHLHPLFARHQPAADIFARMVGAATIAKLDKLEIIMDTILVDVVEIGEHPVSPLKRLTRGYPSV